MANDLETRGTRRSAQVSVGGVCSALISFGDSASNACHGDSGGALLAVHDGGPAKVVGIVSYGDEVHCATPSYAVRVARYANWIDSVMANGAGDGAACEQCPARATDCVQSDGGVGEDAGAEAGPATQPLGSAGGSGDGNGCSIAIGRNRPKFLLFAEWVARPSWHGSF